MPGSERGGRSRLLFVTYVLLAYYLPPLLILMRVIPFEFRFPMLLITSVAVAAYVLWGRYSLASLGIRLDNFGRSLGINISISIVGLLGLALLDLKGLIRAPTVPQWRWFFLFYVFVSCPAQEFLFRSALFAEMENAGINGKYWQIAISSISFCFLHIIYRDAITLCAALLIGIVWGLVYQSCRNLIGVTGSHCVLGVASIFVGLI